MKRLLAAGAVLASAAALGAFAAIVLGDQDRLAGTQALGSFEIADAEFERIDASSDAPPASAAAAGGDRRPKIIYVQTRKPLRVDPLAARGVKIPCGKGAALGGYFGLEAGEDVHLSTSGPLARGKWLVAVRNDTDQEARVLFGAVCAKGVR